MSRYHPLGKLPLIDRIFIGILVFLMASAFVPAGAAVRVPPSSALYRHRVEQVAYQVWGVNASPARLAAQLHQESTWNAGIKSPVGAIGLAQFMPATAAWMPTVFPRDLPTFDPLNPHQSILAAALYDKWLYDRVQLIGFSAMSECTRWNFTLRGYNGGEMWLLRERASTLVAKGNPNNWLDVEKYRLRGTAAHKENIGYPRKILITLEPGYIAAGWAGKAVCS